MLPHSPRYDGIESVSMIFGAGLSPTVFRLFGFYGNYIVRYAGNILV